VSKTRPAVPLPATAGKPLPATVPLPAGFRITLDPSTRQVDEHTWFGGSPRRTMRLTAAGRTAWRELLAGPVVSRAAGLLARRLTDAGLAHPVPPQRTEPLDVTVVIPARDRADLLDRCLAAVGDRYPVVVVDDGSRDPDAIAAVTDRHGAKLLRRTENGGPGPARNTGLSEVASEIIAFLDSDCAPGQGWIEALAAQFADPLVAAVAPRIVGIAKPTWSGRYAMANGALDLGDRPASVAPRGRVPYLPTAALLVRRAALLDVVTDGAVFDPALRTGEDVDLIWRLHRAGWRVRYQPDVRVGHHEPASWPALLARRFRYGTSAAPLAQRHPSAVPALIVPTLRGLRRAGLPGPLAVRTALSAAVSTWLGVGRYGTQFAAPALVLLAVSGGRARRIAAVSLLLGPPLAAWLDRRPALDPARFVLGQLADDMAYGLGVWVGCVRQRTTLPLHPIIV
jgi:mycofactocin system glycosyltransferase